MACYLLIADEAGRERPLRAEVLDERALREDEARARALGVVLLVELVGDLRTHQKGGGFSTRGEEKKAGGHGALSKSGGG